MTTTSVGDKEENVMNDARQYEKARASSGWIRSAAAAPLGCVEQRGLDRLCSDSL